MQKLPSGRWFRAMDAKSAFGSVEICRIRTNQQKSVKYFILPTGITTFRPESTSDNPLARRPVLHLAYEVTVPNGTFAERAGQDEFGDRRSARSALYRVMKKSATLLRSESTGVRKHKSVPVTEQSMPMAVVRLFR